MKSNDRLRKFVLLSFFVAIELVLMFTPLGYIPIGPIRATTLHIPVIICSILLGYKEGMFLGLVFGLTSLFINTFMPSITSFVFSPFITIGGISGNYASLIIVLLPRILIGFNAKFFYAFFSKLNGTIRIGISACLSTFLHTVLVMGGIYFFFAKEYALARNIEIGSLFGVIMGVIFSNGVIEMILSGIICVSLIRVISPLFKGVE